MEYSADLSNEKYEYGSCNYKLKIRLHCGSNKEYYSVRLYGAELMMENDTVAYWDTTSYRSKYFSVNDPIVNSTINIEDAIDGDDGSFGGYEMTFGTDKFIGGEHEFTIEFSYNGYISNGVSLMDMPVILQVSAISEDLYLYDRTADGYDSDMDDLFSEPVQVHCNIVGGIGIFGASTIAKYRLQSPKPNKKLKSINRK